MSTYTLAPPTNEGGDVGSTTKRFDNVRSKHIIGDDLTLGTDAITFANVNHSNRTIIDKLSDSSGNLLYDGNVIGGGAFYQAFTSDGTTDEFTLDNSTLLTNGVLVTINGLLQIPTTDYGIVGSTLTLTAIPTNGKVIEVRSILSTSTIEGITDALDTTNFNGILSATEDTIQKAFDKIDDIDVGSTTLVTTNFNGILSATEDTVQKAFDKIDDIELGSGTSAGVSFLVAADRYSVGVEVLTNKYFDSYPVYRKVISFGTLPNATTKNVAHGLTNIRKFVNVEATVFDSSNEGRGTTFYHPTTSAVTHQIWVTSANVSCLTNGDRTAWSAYVTVEYTKTTDSQVSNVEQMIGGNFLVAADKYETGTEVQTNKFYDNYPVYRKVINFGGFPIAGAWSNPYGTTNHRAWICTSISGNGSTMIAAIYGVGLYRSVNYGVTWGEIYPPGGTAAGKNWRWSSISHDGSVILVSITTGRLYLSTNSGTTWTEAQPAGAVDRVWYSVSVSANGLVLLAAAGGGRLYKSINSGVSWTEVNPVGGSAVDRVWETCDASFDGTCMIAGIYPGRLYYSSNTGVSWNEIQPAGNVDRNWHACRISYDGKTILAAAYGARCYISRNSGTSWNELQPAGAVDKNWNIATMSSDGSVIILGASGGRLYESQNYGSQWVELTPATAADRSWNSGAVSADGTYSLMGISSGSVTGFLYMNTNIAGHKYKIIDHNITDISKIVNVSGSCAVAKLQLPYQESASRYMSISANNTKIVHTSETAWYTEYPSDTIYATVEYTKTTDAQVADVGQATSATLNTSNFKGLLTSAENTIQKAFDRIDDSANFLVPSDKYSIGTEVLTNKYFDDYPVYRKVVDFGALPNNTTKSVAHGLTFSSLRMLIKLSIMRKSTSYMATIPVVSTSAGTSGVTQPYIDATSIYVTSNSDYSSYSTCYTILEYTKTTDSKVSAIQQVTGGNFLVAADKYSIDTEVLTNKFFNGYPVYRKVITFGALPNNTTKNVAHGLTLANVNVTSLTGNTYKSSTGQYQALPYGSSNSTYSISMSILSTNISVSTTADYSGFTLTYIYVEYTKSADSQVVDMGQTTSATLITNEFNGLLSPTEDTIQKAFNKIDDFDATAVSLNTTNFNGLLSTDDNTIQKAFDKLDDSAHFLVAADKHIVGTEVLTNKFFNSYPVYRKVVDYGTLPNASYKYVAHGITSIRNMCSMKGVTYSTANVNFSPIPTTHPTGIANQIQLSIEGANIYIANAANWSTYSAYITLEYTKTTDSQVADMGQVTSASLVTTNFNGLLSATEDTIQKAFDKIDNASLTFATNADVTTIGTEVLTNKIYEGRRVYRKGINFGALPNATTKSVAHGVAGIQKVTYVQGNTSGGTPIPYVSSSGLTSQVSMHLTSTDVVMVAGTNQSADTATVILEYTKTVDPIITDIKQTIDVQKDVFSTTEVKTNKVWTDGRPIYRKVIDCGALPNATGKNVAHGLTFSEIAIVHTHGYAYNSTTYVGLAIPHASVSYPVIFSLSVTNVELTSVSNMSAYNVTTVTLEYTKTADITQSYTVSTHKPSVFSATETPIGEWVDGSIVYRKVVNFGALPNATTKNVAHNITGLGNLISSRGFSKSSLNTNQISIPYASGTSTSVIRTGFDSTNVTVVTLSDWSSCTVTYFILEYTKS